MSRKDLVVLAADRDMRAVLEQVLNRPKALGIRAVDAMVLADHRHDPACAREGVRVLAEYAKDFNHALLVFDHEGSGRERESPTEIEASLDAAFERSDWDRRARTVVVSPELEVWLWGGSPHVDSVMGWTDRATSVRQWLANEGWWPQGAPKPGRPKEAFRSVAREMRTPVRSRSFEEIARRMSLHRCTDRAFLRLRETLQQWFPPEAP